MRRKPYVLIAEDDEDDRFLVEAAMKECGHRDHLTFVENGVELLTFLRAEKKKNPMEKHFPTFILLDLNMPKKDGREVLKEIKEDEDLRVIPIVVFTTTKNENEVRRCYELGANTYVVKPVSFDKLVKVVGDIRNYWFNVAFLS
jgi:two-component system response regulator